MQQAGIWVMTSTLKSNQISSMSTVQMLVLEAVKLICGHETHPLQLITQLLALLRLQCNS